MDVEQCGKPYICSYFTYHSKTAIIEMTDQHDHNHNRRCKKSVHFKVACISDKQLFIVVLLSSTIFFTNMLYLLLPPYSCNEHVVYLARTALQLVLGFRSAHTQNIRKMFRNPLKHKLHKCIIIVMYIYEYDCDDTFVN